MHGRPSLWWLVVLYAFRGRHHQQRLHAPTRDRVSGGRIRSGAAGVGHHVRLDIGRWLRLCRLFFRRGLPHFDTFDFWVGNVVIFILAMIQSIMYGWVFGIERGEREAHQGAHLRIPRFVQWLLKYVVPVYLMVIFVMFCWQNLPGYIEAFRVNPVATGSIVFIAVTFIMLLVLVHIAGLRWQAEGRFDHFQEERRS